jgi:signal transduction histidine kinase
MRTLQAERLLRNARVIIPAGFLLVLAAILAVVIGLIRSRDADMAVMHTFEVERAAQKVLIDINDAAIAKRSYLLTGTPAYLESFASTMPTIPVDLAELNELTADDPNQQARMPKLDTLVEAKMSEFRETLALIKQGRRDEALAILNSAESQKLSGDLRDTVESILGAERNLLDARQARAAQERYLQAGLIGLALFFAVFLSGLLAASTLQAVKGLVARTKELEEESRLRHEAESTLRQAQKMEAVGQLTGGIAHDFNNLLTIIIGNLDTMKRQIATHANPGTASELSSKLSKPIEAALQGANSASQLTHRLLAFSRRQPLTPARIDMNRLVSGMIDMLRRTLGAEISIETIFAAGLWPAFADANQLENVLLNLALNAKAAMPEGGCLTIETANTYLDDAYVRHFGDVDAGQYVVLCVTDTGTGIPKDILHRVFDPFFTTKTLGEGSGLGLAMVHGFVKQSGGHVRIYSEEGHGTTVKIYLPRLTAAEELAAVPVAKPVALAPAPRAKPHETILLVEDNDGVRQYAKAVLEDLGYLVLGVADAQEALRLVAKKPQISLLFTDVVLPGSDNGRVLAGKLQERYPGLPVLYTTGYTRNAIVHQGRLDTGVQLLNKPFTQQDLARKIREMLDA